MLADRSTFQNMEWFVITLTLNLLALVPSTCEEVEEERKEISHEEIAHHYVDLLQGLDMALDKYNSGVNSKYKFVFLPATMVASRAVKGGNHFLVHVEIAPSSCQNTPENASKRIDVCPVNFSDQAVLSQVLWCDFGILSRPWLGSIEVQKSACRRLIR